jgi:hypothetical protein
MKAMDTNTKYLCPLSVIKLEGINDLEAPEVLSSINARHLSSGTAFLTPETFNRLKFLVFSIPKILKRYTKISDRRVLFEIFVHYITMRIIRPSKDFIDQRREWNKKAADIAAQRDSKEFKALFKFFSKVPLPKSRPRIAMTNEAPKKVRNFDLRTYLTIECIMNIAANSN